MKKLLNNAPSVKDIKVKSNLKKLRVFDKSVPGRDNGSNNDDDGDNNDNADDNDKCNGAVTPDNLSDLPDVSKQD